MEKPAVLFVDDDEMILEALRRQMRHRAKTWDLSFFDQPEEALAA